MSNRYYALRYRTEKTRINADKIAINNVTQQLKQEFLRINNKSMAGTHKMSDSCSPNAVGTWHVVINEKLNYLHSIGK